MNELEPVVATVTVEAGPATAFAVFTEGIGSWWPMLGHSVGEERVVDVVLECRQGGTLHEVWDDGTRQQWGEVLGWDPPTALALAWNPGGYGTQRPATRVDVTFTATDDGRTLVRLVHSGWGAWAEDEVRRRGYAGGWPTTLDRYADHVSRGAATVTG